MLAPVALAAAEWEFQTYDGGFVNGTFKAGSRFATIQTKGEMTVPGSGLFDQIYISPTDKDKSYIRVFTLKGVHAGSLVVDVETQESGKGDKGEKSRTTLYYEIRDSEAGIPILGGGAPPLIMYVKVMAKNSTFKTRLAAYAPPAE
jgi:hypothetical protein